MPTTRPARLLLDLCGELDVHHVHEAQPDGGVEGGADGTKAPGDVVLLVLGLAALRWLLA